MKWPQSRPWTGSPRIGRCPPANRWRENSNTSATVPKPWSGHLRWPPESSSGGLAPPGKRRISPILSNPSLRPTQVTRPITSSWINWTRTSQRPWFAPQHGCVAWTSTWGWKRRPGSSAQWLLGKPFSPSPTKRSSSITRPSMPLGWTKSRVGLASCPKRWLNVETSTPKVNSATSSSLSSTTSTQPWPTLSNGPIKPNLWWLDVSSYLRAGVLGRTGSAQTSCSWSRKLPVSWPTW